jgi:hypothetical protein
MDWLRETERLREVVLWVLIVEHSVTAGVKFLTVVLMVRNQEKTPLDRAIIANQVGLAFRHLAWASVLYVPATYEAHLREWLYAWLVVAAVVLGSAVKLLVELWRERIKPRWRTRAWREGRSSASAEEARAVTREAREVASELREVAREGREVTAAAREAVAADVDLAREGREVAASGTEDAPINVRAAAQEGPK